jgi:hypothetical protein
VWHNKANYKNLTKMATPSFIKKWLSLLASYGSKNWVLTEKDKRIQDGIIKSNVRSSKIGQIN